MSDERSAEFDPQPLPTAGDGRDVMGELIRLVDDRRQFGVMKYKTIFSPNNGRDAMRDARDEAIDLAAYLTQMIMERDGKG